eukprot:1138902-Pelagomonas_calceolata.AAC.1
MIETVLKRRAIVVIEPRAPYALLFAYLFLASRRRSGSDHVVTPVDMLKGMPLERLVVGRFVGPSECDAKRNRIAEAESRGGPSNKVVMLILITNSNSSSTPFALRSKAAMTMGNRKRMIDTPMRSNKIKRPQPQ